MQTAIITGASVGIGAATAAAFVAEGFRVYNLARRRCPVDGVHSLNCDLADPAAVAAACDTLEEIVRASDSVALVHNASQNRKDSAISCDSASLAAVLDTNVVALNRVNERLLPHMPAGSSVLYVGSTHMGQDLAVVQAIAGMNSFNRLIEPAEIAELIRWAHHHPVINGAVLHSNLGQRES